MIKVRIQYSAELGASVVNAATGEVIPCTAASVHLNAHGMQLVLQLDQADCSIIGAPGFSIRDPDDGQMKLVKKVEFLDRTIWTHPVDRATVATQQEQPNDPSARPAEPRQ